MAHSINQLKKKSRDQPELFAARKISIASIWHDKDFLDFSLFLGNQSRLIGHVLDYSNPARLENRVTISKEAPQNESRFKLTSLLSKFTQRVSELPFA